MIIFRFGGAFRRLRLLVGLRVGGEASSDGRWMATLRAPRPQVVTEDRGRKLVTVVRGRGRRSRAKGKAERSLLGPRRRTLWKLAEGPRSENATKP